ncbi:MAG: hypothetical protein LBE13_07280 [Bacteroidales bacterium]|jgi:hypothetical protein|nr:hypothetical protein [Bacteroidales bacterium]
MDNLIFCSSGSYSFETESRFVALKIQCSNIKRIHGISDKEACYWLASEITDTDNFEIVFQSGERVSGNKKQIAMKCLDFFSENRKFEVSLVWGYFVY